MLNQKVAAPIVDIKPAAIAQARASSSLKTKPTVLVVDDEHSTLIYLEHTLVQQGYRVVLAENGEDALKALNAATVSISAVVMDLNMPGLNGIEVVETMKQSQTLKYIPVIMTTGSSDPEVVREGIAAGVYYCLHKPINAKLLGTLVEAALHEFDQTKTHQQVLASQSEALGMMETDRYTCRTLHEVEVLSQFLALAYPDPKRVIIGISELLINAVEHGNLGMTYEEKNQLVTAGRWRETTDARQKLLEHANKKVDVVLQRKVDGIYLQISDEGEGFEWWRYLEIDPARATHPNGRGIALANKISFNRLQFTHNGSRVLGVVDTAQPSVTGDGGRPKLKW